MNSDAEGDSAESESLPAWCNPTRAKDMDGIGGEIVRGLVEAGAVEELKEMYGISIDEAHLSLHCADLASLRVWDLDALIEAATVYQLEQLRYFEDQEGAEVAAIKSTCARIARQVRLATLAEGSAVLIHPADAILLLERSNIPVFYELRDAIRARLGGQETMTSQDWERMKSLAGIATAEPEQEAKAGTQKKLTVEQEAEVVKLYARGRGVSMNKLAPQFGVSRPTINKVLQQAGVKD